MWGTLLKVGGSILAAVGLDWAVDSYKENEAAKAEAAQMEKQAKWGKFILIGALVMVAYSMMKKGK